MCIRDRSIYDSGKAQHALDVVAKRGLTYEQEGALWIRTSEFGDDKDRVLRKSDGTLYDSFGDASLQKGVISAMIK